MGIKRQTERYIEKIIALVLALAILALVGLGILYVLNGGPPSNDPTGVTTGPRPSVDAVRLMVVGWQ